MKRLMIMTVGKTHSGKTTFARLLEQSLENSFVMDQDNQAEFINTYYQKLQPNEGPNIFKNSLSRFIVEYAIENTKLHLIICNSNRNRISRLKLFDELFTQEQFIRILVNFDIPDEVLLNRVKQSQRSTNIFRGSYSSFEEVLIRQQHESSNEDVIEPTIDEAEYLFVIKDNKDVESVIQKIVYIAKCL
ncbi:ATP-binding protein [Rummeliibacillus sp. TYF005]|uniref:AAA family ATPase n=1 Tax=Rummeliibacillus sp. TYF005 TaxID=2058214 RepID=UPI000F51EA36|nr:AAA family ATPase [Rummeliibacillus sp. TYF005]RPJ94131.1 ATP-binding protein [Rummeliibacillus sp. TYF005]